jgi:hypothetical protein
MRLTERMVSPGITVWAAVDVTPNRAAIAAPMSALRKGRVLLLMIVPPDIEFHEPMNRS